MDAWTLCLLLLGLNGAFLFWPKDWQEASLLSALGSVVKVPWWRSWAAILGAYVAAQFLRDPAYWVLIDLIAAIIVIFPPRIGFQKAIAWLFAAMMLFELGWLMSARMNSGIIVDAGWFCGWLQLAALLAWGINDRYGIARIRDWVFGPRLADHAVDGG